MTRLFRNSLFALLILFVLFAFPQMLAFAENIGNQKNSWWEARRDSADLSPSPKIYPDAIVQVFGARTWGWRGNFAVHTWIALKRQNAQTYERYEIIGWRAYNGGQALSYRTGAPDNFWHGNPPELLSDVRGSMAESIIEKIDKLIDTYPHKSDYVLWPGPNSNSFVAHIGRNIPELGLELPPTAIGKDYIVDGDLISTPVSGQGVQLSLFGYGGFAIGPNEGAELHLLGLTLGYDFEDQDLKLPGLGRVSLN
ncbi:DUF3750 domain-containing protein [Sneathiella marina]|uniref:DUF3750 domain-containing protein n=1 Tax=Sneathiella marina TaxID=2950108 RepID=A0ABY4W498_9PROT|nr:DUF3750 domain-containing protein [Sneathiella marina]USG59486.1 DUF3750 domain-containing protein [Sneathiella marina]